MDQPILSLVEITQVVHDLAATIGVPSKYLPTFGATADFGRPHIEISSIYHWVVVERGTERERRSTISLDELLYWSLKSATFNMACDFELEHRRPDEDFRRQLFAKHIELMSSLNHDWGQALSDKYDRIIHAHPFDDG
ncbi:Imm63 family immunity protein [Phyllobacterium sp. TAF24]|uniref:Imm63 family immunity protein n=1 Tax=Phyllobacterium sp. TAF24 TaxID=3233068 RepID=UPI003F9525E8